LKEKWKPIIRIFFCIPPYSAILKNIPYSEDFRKPGILFTAKKITIFIHLNSLKKFNLTTNIEPL